MKKAVIFVKESTESNMEIQEKMCRDFAAEHDIEVEKIINKFSGLYDLGVDYVLVSEFNKVSRNTHELAFTEKALHEHGIGLISVKHGMAEFKARHFAHNIVDKIKGTE